MVLCSSESMPVGGEASDEPEPEPGGDRLAATARSDRSVGDDGDGLATVSGRYATLGGIRSEDDAADAPYTEGTAFDSVCLGPDAVAVQHNSVLLVPALLSGAECAQLIEDVERCYTADSERNRQKLMHRMLIPQLSEATQALFDTVLRERVLPLVSKECDRLAPQAAIAMLQLVRTGGRLTNRIRYCTTACAGCRT